MIRVEDLVVTYEGNERPALRTPRLLIGEGELVLVAGPTGSGKSTFLRALNGLVPHFTGGRVAGRVVIDGRDTRECRPRDLADVIALVQQNPAASFVADTVEDEIAYGMETLGVPPGVMRRRVEETLDLLGLAGVRRRVLRELSGGQQQRVAIAAVLAAGPHVVVLDEPTSALDPVAAEEVLSAVQRLVHDLGLTVVLAVHRLERVIHHADQMIIVQDGVASALLSPAEAMRRSPVFPPVIELGRMCGWEPLPLSVRAARRLAGPLRDALAPVLLEADAQARRRDLAPRRRPRLGRLDPARRTSPAPEPAARLRRATVRLGDTVALREVDLRFGHGDVTAVMGRNGAGKSTLLWCLAGQRRPQSGSVSVAGADPSAMTPGARARLVGMVPQDPMALLYAETVARECADADRECQAAPGATADLLALIAGPIDPGRHPRDLSEGQRLALALAIVLSREPGLVLLDEPTRGLDYAAKARLVAVLRRLAGAGHAVVMATHDVELAAEVATRVVLLADGEVVADDPSPQVLAASTAYAPQVARVLHPVPVLTVEAARLALQEAR
jgi:energy-coupling factor transport system ATP-binding protein